MVTMLAWGALLYAGACAVLFVSQRSMIYFPRPRRVDTRTITLGLPKPEPEVLASTRPREGQDALIYFGGNAEDVSASLPAFAQAFPDHALYFLHYRSYGGSGGTPSEGAILRDAVALFDLVRAEHSRIAVVGRSLGSGVAVHLASRRPVSRLVLVTPYSSLQEIAARRLPYFPVRWLMRDPFESWRYAPLVSAPTLLIVAEHDEVIPRWSTDRLYPHFARGVASMQVIAGVEHNTISESPEYFKLLGAAL